MTLRGLASAAAFAESARLMWKSARQLGIDLAAMRWRLSRQLWQLRRARCPRWRRSSRWVALFGCWAAGFAAAQSVDGSLILTSDYLERGVSKSADQPALQLDVHATNAAGWVAGVFASNAQFQPGGARNAEFDVYAGYGRAITADWHARMLVGGYWYPWNPYGSGYDYGEFAVDLAYREWLSLQVTYSPDAPRVVLPGLVSVTATSAAITVQRPLWGGLFANAGVGYAHYGGVSSLDYGYFSAGVVYERSPLSLSVGYVGSSAAAKALYDNGSGGGRWAGTVVWRFF